MSRPAIQGSRLHWMSLQLRTSTKRSRGPSPSCLNCGRPTIAKGKAVRSKPVGKKQKHVSPVLFKDTYATENKENTDTYAIGPMDSPAGKKQNMSHFFHPFFSRTHMDSQREHVWGVFGQTAFSAQRRPHFVGTLGVRRIQGAGTPRPPRR